MTTTTICRHRFNLVLKFIHEDWRRRRRLASRVQLIWILIGVKKLHVEGIMNLPRSCTSGMGIVLGGRGSAFVTGLHLQSWLWFCLVEVHPSSVLGSSCEVEIYAGAMAAQELRWLTYLLNNLGERPRSPPALYVDNKAMLALCQEQRLEHISLCYFLFRELQQRGQLRLSYVASQANTADVSPRPSACITPRCPARSPAAQLPRALLVLPALALPCPASAARACSASTQALRQPCPYCAHCWPHALPGPLCPALTSRPAEPPSRAALPSRPAEPPCRAILPYSVCSPVTATALLAATTAAIAAMATPTLLTFDAEGHPIDFENWLEDLEWYLKSVTR
ncbi:unnamed protein product [Closterium sp. NIES-54]